jgi:CO/xanthine dehydrogenase Mo-binding subunit
MVANPDEMALIPGILRHLPSGKEISLKKMSRFLDHSERVAADRFRAPVAGDMVTDDPDLRLHGIPHAIFSYGAHLALVEVDELTGMVEVKRYLVVTDCGRVINPQLLEQQMHGGVAQGLGYALSEEMSVEGGRIITQDLATYIIPGARDVPDMEFIPVELNEDTGPYGLKGAGEIATDGPLPAVANAVADACGVRLSRFPITAERVMVALNKVDDRR